MGFGFLEPHTHAISEAKATQFSRKQQVVEMARSGIAKDLMMSLVTCSQFAKLSRQVVHHTTEGPFHPLSLPRAFRYSQQGGTIDIVHHEVLPSLTRRQPSLPGFPLANMTSRAPMRHPSPLRL